jgi:carbonic anhydrase/acetyltransferase-like protein (isoleucine patch superfamily)
VPRGDSGRIVIGEGSNVQGNAVLHESVTVGRNCTIAHLALVHGAAIEDEVLVGNGALVYEGSHIGNGAVIGAGAVLAPNTRVPPGVLMLGSPARQVRPANTDLRALVEARASDYESLRVRYLAALRLISAPARPR